MKSFIGASVMALLLVCLAVPGLVLAGPQGSLTAAGSFKFALQDGEIRFVEFKAQQEGEGAVGEMTFSDPVAIPVPDPDNPEKEGTKGVLVRAKFDCMDTVKNTAVIGGEIFESNVPETIGLRVLLVVEDNGVEGEKDRVSWGIYQLPGKWIPTDAELEDDKGAHLTWWATDAERRDDVGIPMPPNRLVTCKSFALASHEFPEIKYAGGDLQVQQR